MSYITSDDRQEGEFGLRMFDGAGWEHFILLPYSLDDDSFNGFFAKSLSLIVVISLKLRNQVTLLSCAASGGGDLRPKLMRSLSGSLGRGRKVEVFSLHFNVDLPQLCANFNIIKRSTSLESDRGWEEQKSRKMLNKSRL